MAYKMSLRKALAAAAAAGRPKRSEVFFMLTFTQALARVQGPARSQTLIPPRSERAAWDKPAPLYRAGILSRAERNLQRPIPPLTRALWDDFFRSGRRTAFEDRYFTRRRQLNQLILAFCISEEEKFLKGIEAYIRSFLAEPTWCLPAHQRHEGEERQPEPDRQRPVLDLSAGETAAQLALTLFLAGDRLPRSLTEEIREALEQRVLTPYRQEHFWWMGRPGDKLNNWTPWCTQNVLITTLFAGAALTPLLPQICRSLDYFVAGYGEDGCCDEGVQYYRHASLTLWGATEFLSELWPEAFSGIFAEPKIKNMAHYILRMHVAGPWYFNFADCSAQPGPCGIKEYLLGRRVGDRALAAKAAADLGERALFAEPEYDSLGVALLGELLTYLYADEALASEHAAAAKEDCYYPSVGLFSAARGPWDLAVKAGDNNDAHNHNDTGSFTLFAYGEPLFIDVGVGEYTAQTFGPERYSLWTMRSSWHNLPAFGETEQKPGPAYKAELLDLRLGGKAPAICLELAQAYPPVAGLSTYRRRAELAADAVEILDETDYPGEVTLYLMTVHRPEETAAGIRLGPALLTLSGAAGFSFETIALNDTRLRLAWPENIYRLRLRFGKRLGLRISPAEEAGHSGPAEEA